MNVLATANSPKSKLSSKAGGSKPSPFVPCDQQIYCFNKGVCYVVRGLGTIFCNCTAGFTGERCEERDSPGLVRGSVDQILSFVGIFMAAVMLVTLIVILYCLLKFRHEYSQDKKQFWLKSCQEPSSRLNGVIRGPMTEVDLTKNVVTTLKDNQQIKPRTNKRIGTESDRLNGAEHGVINPWKQACSDEKPTRPRISTSSSIQGLLGSEDEVDFVRAHGLAQLHANPPTTSDEKTINKHLTAELCAKQGNTTKDTELKQDLQQVVPNTSAGQSIGDAVSEKDNEPRLNAELNAILQELGAYMISSKPNIERHIPVGGFTSGSNDTTLRISGPTQIEKSCDA